MSNPKGQSDQQQSTSESAASPQKQQQASPPEKSLLIEPLTIPRLSDSPLSASSTSLHNKENTQVQASQQQQQQQQQEPVKSGNNKQQLSSLVRDASNDLLGTSVSFEQQQQQHKKLGKSHLGAEFLDNSTRSQTSTNKSLESPNNGHQHNQRQQQTTKPTTTTTGRVANDSGIEASASHSEEAQRLLGSESCRCSDCWCGTLEDKRNRLHRGRNQRNLIENNNNIMSLASQTIKLMPAYFVAELIGTFLLVVIGDGSIAAYVLTKRPVDMFAACFAFGVGAMIASFVAGKISGAHLNPAATLAFALDNRLKWQLVPVYMLAQYLGGFLAALVLFLNYSEGISALDGGAHIATGNDNSTGGIFATYPAHYVTVAGSLLDQIVGTAVLLFSLAAVGDKTNLGLEERFQPPIVALVIGLVCLAFNPNCGAIFNPARDLAPRLLTAIFGYEGVWAPIDGTYWILAGVVGPHIGAIIGVFAYKYLIGVSLEAHKRHMQMIQSVECGGGASNESSFDDKKVTRLQSSFQQQHKQYNTGHHGHTKCQMTGESGTTTTSTPVQRRQELSDYGSAVIR